MEIKLSYSANSMVSTTTASQSPEQHLLSSDNAHITAQATSECPCNARQPTQLHL